MSTKPRKQTPTPKELAQQLKAIISVLEDERAKVRDSTKLAPIAKDAGASVARAKQSWGRSLLS